MIRGHGTNALGDSTIFTETEGTFKLFMNGTNSDALRVYCNSTDICKIDCQSSHACSRMQLYCFGTCFVDCDALNGIDCPTTFVGVYSPWTTNSPSTIPTTIPSYIPSSYPSEQPSDRSTVNPTIFPTFKPTNIPSDIPTVDPTSSPTFKPTDIPSSYSLPTSVPTVIPSNSPTAIPSIIPTVIPTNLPTTIPTVKPTSTPSTIPTSTPTANPTIMPTNTLTLIPTFIPTCIPTASPTTIPTTMPTVIPTLIPTVMPTRFPTTNPTNIPTNTPTVMPTNNPTQSPQRETTQVASNTATFTVVLSIDNTESTIASTRFNSNGKIRIHGKISLNGTSYDDESLTDLNIDYFWKDLNGILDFSKDFVTSYKNYLVIDGTALTSEERDMYLASNTHFDIALSVESNNSSNKINGTGRIELEVNDAPANGSCLLYVNGSEYNDHTADKIEIYALTTQVDVNCSGWQDEDSPPFEYTFEIFDGISKVLIRQKMTLSSHFFQLGYGNYTFYSIIWDTLNATTKVSQKIITALPTSTKNDDDSTAEQIENVESFLEDTFYVAAESGDTSAMASAVVAAVSVLELIDTNTSDVIHSSNGTTSTTTTKLLTEIRSDMLNTLIDVFEQLPINEENIEIESQTISTIVRTPDQIDTETAKSTFARIGTLVDNGINATQNGVMNDDTANAVADSMVDLSQSLTIKENSSNRSATVAKLTILMMDILMLDKLQYTLPGETGYEYSSSDVSVSGKRLNMEQINDDGSMDSCANDVLEYNQLGSILRSANNNDTSSAGML